MFLNNNLTPEGGTSKCNNADLAQIPVGLQLERLPSCARVCKSTQEGFSCVVSHAGVATLVPYGYRLYSVFFFDSV